MEMIIILNILLRIVLLILTHIVELDCFVVALLTAGLIGIHFHYEGMTVFFIGLGIFMLLYAIHMSKYGFWILSILFTVFWTYIIWGSFFSDYEGLAQKIITSVMCFLFILFLHLVSKVRIQGDCE